MSKILVALSGGVDSAVAMLLLKQQGHDVSAAYMKTWMNEEGIDVFGDCPWHQDIADAKACADFAGVEFEAVDFIKEYREQVVEDLIEGYKNGRTPNPDVLCNRRMKFGKFLDYARARGFEKVATGHYCSSRTNADGSMDLLSGLDPSKDQSYFLSMITQEQLQSAVFPIGSMLKDQVRDFARMSGLPNAAKKDSQGICFLGKIKIQDFLKYHLGENPGDIADTRGKTLGRHKGLFNYTIGQRRGIGVPSNTDGKNYVVVAKDFETNRLVIALEQDSKEAVMRDEIFVGPVNWINKARETQCELYGRVRYRDDLVKIRFTPQENGGAKVEFETPQRALAPGQVLALYETPRLLLGGSFFLAGDFRA